MKRRIEIMPRADSDIDSQFVFLSKQSKAVARKFLIEVNRTIQTIGKKPESGSLAETDDPDDVGLNVRTRPVEGFPSHLVFFIAIPDGVRIQRVLHAARRITASMILDD